MTGPTGQGVGGPIDDASSAIEKSRAIATKQQTGQSTYEQSAAHTKISSQVEVLTHINNYFRTLQTGKKATELGGYSETDLRGSVQTELESLKGLATQLNDNLPPDEETQAQLKTYTAQLTRMLADMSAKPPKSLSSEDLDSLKGMLTHMNNMAKNLPVKAKATYWTEQSTMFKTLSNKITAQLSSQSTEYSKNVSIQKLHSALKSLNTFFATKPPPKFTEKELQDLLALYNNRTILTTSQNSKLQTFLTQVSGVNFKPSPTKTMNIGNTIAYAKTYAWLQTYLKANPHATPAKIKAALQKYIMTLAKGPLTTTMNQIAENFSALISKFGSVSDNKVTLFGDDEFYANFEGDLEEVKNPPYLEEFFTDQEAQKAVSDNEQLVKSGTQLNTTANALMQAQEASTTAAGHALGMSPSVTSKSSTQLHGSLQDQFSQAILGHYMPLQEDYLQKKAHKLAWSNEEASIYNTLLGDTVGFANASTQFNFSSVLRTSHTTTSSLLFPGGTFGSRRTYTQTYYAGSVSGMAQKLANELKYANEDLTNCKKGITSINTYLEDLGYPNGDYNATAPLNKNAKFVKEYGLTITQVRKLASSLATQKTNLQGAEANLTQLINTLKEIHITPVYKFSDYNTTWHVNISPTASKVPGEFTVTWNGYPQGAPTSMGEATEYTDDNESSVSIIKSRLSPEESNVINGSKGKPGEALGNINQAFTTASQNASNTSQTAQMQLQMTMTEVQQEWTIVSTALQILNQMYMSIAKSIYSL